MKFTDLLHAREFLAVPREAQRILQSCLEQMDIRTAPDGAVRFVIEGDVALLDRLAVWGRQANEAAAFDGDIVTGMMRAGCYVSVQREAQEILAAMLARLDVRPMHDGAVIFTVAGDVELQDRLAVWGCLIEDLEDGDLDDEEGPDAEHDDRCGRPVLMVLPILDLRADLVAAPPILCAA